MSLVSVIIPTYNRAQLISDSIDSVLSQVDLVREIIVVDDGSTDHTSTILSKYLHPVRYLRQQNRGPSAARNLGLAEAQGEFVAFQDSDDLWAAQKLSQQVEFMRRQPEVDFVFGDMANFTVDPKFQTTPEIKNRSLHDYLVKNAYNLEDLFEWLVVENVVPTPTVLARRAAIQKVGFFDEKLRLAEDLEYWLRSLDSCRWGFLNSILLYRRRHASNLISDQVSRNRALLEVLNRSALRKSAQSIRTQNLISKKASEISYDLGSLCFRNRAFRESRIHLVRTRQSGRRKFMAFLKYHLAGIIAPFERQGNS
jgi:glycosyltransferase involved in cell wall biosynthesis